MQLVFRVCMANAEKPAFEVHPTGAGKSGLRQRNGISVGKPIARLLVEFHAWQALEKRIDRLQQGVP